MPCHGDMWNAGSGEGWGWRCPGRDSRPRPSRHGNRATNFWANAAGFAPLDGRGRPSLSGLCWELRFEELFNSAQYFRPALRLVDRLPQRRASGDAVGEPRRELLHLPFRSGHFFFQQHLEVGTDHLVAVGFGGFVVGLVSRTIRGCGASLRWTAEGGCPYVNWTGGDARRSTYVLLDLAEDPRICRGHPAYHFVVVPSGAEFHGEGNLHGGSHRFENLADQRQIAQQAGAAVALHDFLRRAAEVQVDKIEAQVFHQARGIGQYCRTAAKELGRDRVLVFVEMKVASPNAKIAQDAVGRGELGHNQAASAEVLDEAAEDGVGNAGHGREHGGGSDADAADLQGRGKHPC